MEEKNIKQVDQIMTALTQVIDPELQVDVVNLGLIYGIDIEGDKATIKMTLTIMGCPLSDYLEQHIQKAVLSVAGIKSCDIKLVWYPVWTTERLSSAAKKQLGVTNHDDQIKQPPKRRLSTFQYRSRKWQMNTLTLFKLCTIVVLLELKFLDCLKRWGV